MFITVLCLFHFVFISVYVVCHCLFSSVSFRLCRANVVFVLLFVYRIDLFFCLSSF